MNIPFLDLKKNFKLIEKPITAKINEIITNCDFIHGKEVGNFEKNFSEYIGLKYFIGCANGTDALEIAIKSLELKDNDEVIVQGNTFISTSLGVINNNVKLVLCDIEKDTYMIDIEELKKYINKNTKAIIIVHLYGFMPNMDIICNICKENNIFLIEDCAQAHGAIYNNKKAGTFGDISCFSFYPGKNLGAYGDAGGIGTDNKILNNKIRKLINIGSIEKYQHEIIGRNSRLDTIQAAILNIKLEYLEEWNKKRRKIASIYNKKLIDVGDIKLPKIDNNCIPVYHLYVIRTQYRDQLKDFLGGKNINCLIHYPISIAETNAMKPYNFDLEKLKISISNSKEILSLPLYPELEDSEVEYICNSIKEFFMINNLMKTRSISSTTKNGILHCINNFNFIVKRLFYVDNFENENDIENRNKRGFHCNTNFNELMFIIKGSVKLKLIDQNNESEIIYLNKDDVYYIPNMKWIEYEYLDSNTIILCLVDKELNESETITNFKDFLKS